MINFNQYGGNWTIEKLNILENYLDAYTTALKNQPFVLVYIDAFAGEGWIEIGSTTEPEGKKEFLEGSTLRALKVDDKPFDELVFVEKNPDCIKKLEERLEFCKNNRKIVIEEGDANEFLSYYGQQLTRKRGVLFLDPFSTEVEWQTVEKIAGYKALDTWLLFPVYAISRMLPKSKKTDEISSRWVAKLNKVYGDESWRDLYSESPQGNLFGNIELGRKPGVDGLIRIYKNKLKSLLGNRFLDQHRLLKNSKNSTLFAFMFFVGNPAGIAPAKKIAKHILDHI